MEKLLEISPIVDEPCLFTLSSLLREGELDKDCFRKVSHICREHRSNHRQWRPRGRISRHDLQVRIGNTVGCRRTDDFQRHRAGLNLSTVFPWCEQVVMFESKLLPSFGTFVRSFVRTKISILFNITKINYYYY